MSATTLIAQRVRDDCSVCCMAMALGWSYEATLAKALMADVEPRWISRRSAIGYSPGGGTKHPFFLLRDWGFDVEAFHVEGTPWGVAIAWGRRAILSVQSKTGWRGWHDVYWDGAHVFDPGSDPYDDSLQALPIKDVIVFREVV